MKKKKYRIMYIISIVGLMLSIICLCLALNKITDIPTVSNYQDMGIHTFKPYKMLPFSVKNTSASKRERRMNPKKTIYVVYYQSTDGSDYKWKVEKRSKDEAKSLLAQNENIERRVLTEKETGYYMTLDTKETMDSYFTKQRNLYIWVIGLSSTYIVCYFVVMIIKQKKRKSMYI